MDLFRQPCFDCVSLTGAGCFIDPAVTAWAAGSAKLNASLAQGSTLQ